MRISKHGIGRAKYRRTLKKVIRLMALNGEEALNETGMRHLLEVAKWLSIHESRMYPPAKITAV